MWLYRGFTLHSLLFRVCTSVKQTSNHVQSKLNPKVSKITVFCSAIPGTLHASRGQLLCSLRHHPRAQLTSQAVKIAESQSSSLKKKKPSELSVNNRGSEWLSCCIALIYRQEGFWQCHFVLIKALGGRGRPAIIYSGHVLAYFSKESLQEANQCIHPCVEVWEKKVSNYALPALIWEQEGTRPTLATQPGANFVFAERVRGGCLRNWP